MTRQKFQIARIAILGIVMLFLMIGCGGGGNPTTPPDQNGNDDISIVTAPGYISLPEGTPYPPSSLEVSTVIGGSVPVAIDGSFHVNANKNVPFSLVVSTNTQGRMILSGLYDSTNATSGNQIMLNSRTTAQAMLFLTPFVATIDPDETRTILSQIELLPDFESFVAVIEQAIKNGNSPYQCNDANFSTLFTNLYKEICEFAINNRRGDTIRNNQWKYNIDPREHNKFWIEEILDKNNVLEACNNAWREADLYAIPYDYPHGTPSGEPVKKGMLSSVNIIPSLSDLIYSGLTNIPGWPQNTYSNTLEFDLDTGSYDTYLIKVYGPGTGNIDPSEQHYLEAPEHRTFIHCIAAPMFQIIAGFSIYKLKCLGESELKVSKDITLAFVALKDGKFDKFFECLASFLCTAATDCADDVIEAGGEGILQKLTCVKLLWDILAAAPEILCTMLDWLLYPCVLETWITRINNAPEWIDSKVGIQSAIPGDQKITITFGTATDPDGDNPVKYTLYYTDNTLFGNENPFVWSNVSIEDATSPYELKGLINDHKYFLGVRAKDSKGLEETNTVTKSATPTAEQNLPPVWDSSIGIQSAIPGNQTITVLFGTATDPDGDNPVTYNLYYCDETATGDNNPLVYPYETVKNVTSLFQLTGLVNGHKYWLGVRAQDSKGLEEENNVILSATPNDSNPFNPVIVKSVDIPGEANGVYVTGGYAYVAVDYPGGLWPGLQIIDVDPPESASIVKSVDTSGHAYEVYVTGGYAYVADEYSGLQIIDVEPIGSASIVKSVDTPDIANGVYVTGGYAYVADYGGGLQIIDVDPIGSASIVKSVDTLGVAYGVYVTGGYAYVAKEYFGLQIIDVEPIGSASIVKAVDTPGYSLGVYVTGGYAYVANFNGGLQIIKLW